MRHSQPAVLSGHTKNLPLPDIVDILRHRHQSGRLVIEYPKQHCVLHFENGELVDARMGDEHGLAALTRIEEQPDAPFTFGPSAAPPDSSIDSASRELALRSLGCWQDAEVFEPEPPAASHAPAGSVLQSTYLSLRGKLSEARQTQKSYGMIPDARNAPRRRRRAAICAAVLAAVLIGASGVMLAWRAGGETVAPTAKVGKASPASQPSTSQPSVPLSSASHSSAQTPFDATPQTVGSVNPNAPPITADNNQTSNSSPQREQIKQPRVTQTFRQEYEAFAAREQTVARQTSTANTEPAPPTRNMSSFATPTTSTSPTTIAATPGDVTVTIVTRIENGRVVQAQVTNPRPGMEAFEASALRAARQRRYPAGTTGSDQVRIKISKQ